jgi:acyl-coenzyme A synthetase/AMP-(fatty) acid ligase
VMIYPMGDQVRMRPDGLFEFIGRRDRQVKIRGLWVDLGEIESALRAAEGVVEAVVVARSVKGGADTLAAFITLDDANTPPLAAALRRAVVAATAEHMAPAEIRVLAEIPRLANYKPDLVRLDAMLSEPGGRLA